MKIQQLDLTVRDLVVGYHDDGDGGVVGYGGASLISARPSSASSSTRANSAKHSHVLVGPKDGTFEIVDGQQRTISIAQYVAEKPRLLVQGAGV